MTARQETVTRVAAGVMLGALLAGAGAWITLAGEFQTKTEVLNLIETQGPIDEALLEYRMNEQDAKLDKLEAMMGEMIRNQNEVMVVFRALVKDFEAYVSQDPDG